ncbi:hypothetical protein KGF36_11830 [Clostridioides sp. ZZV14-6009]|uniref:PD-(D/E)XK nuclease domain-containing protein n=1 Tax=unclassified Clostridioides TaxID=2635829 RepID=UPI001D12197E|nr:hypothetical protein [Clostridioides sp. ZZV14-6153]MCC0735331.1 hypothetical protein [Clostridioides sp. ZZV14-6009]
MSQKVELISNLLNELEAMSDIRLIKEYIDNIDSLNIPFSQTEKSDIDRLLMYQENDFSNMATRKSILSAKSRLTTYLRSLLNKIENKTNLSNMGVFTEDVAKMIIRNVLSNFYMHIYEMYEANTHGKAHITKDKLNDIKIGNEYDVQRILYSIIKPIFPDSRVEVSDDTGNASIRYDIFIEQYDLVIEVKCSRESMTEKKLTEEIGSDGFHYNYKNIFFFIYDKNRVIKNKVAFVNTYTRCSENKNIETIVIQPINL